MGRRALRYSLWRTMRFMTPLPQRLYDENHHRRLAAKRGARKAHARSPRAKREYGVK